jgi:hypothetical protein
MPEGWVDFKAIKEAVTMQMVLDHYKIAGLKREGNDLRGSCPIHKAAPHSKNLSVSLTKNSFRCFASNCAAQGNVLDFVAAMEKCSVRDAALKLQGWFKVGESQSSREEESKNGVTDVKVRRGIYQDESGGLYEVLGTAANLEDENLEELVIFRGLFDGFQYWVARQQMFDPTEDTEGSEHLRRFTLIKRI